MRVGFVYPNLESNFSGISRYSIGILSAMTSDKIEKYCFGNNHLNVADLMEIRCMYNNCKNYELSSREQYMLAGLNDISIIHSFYNPLLLEKREKPKTVLTIHDLSPLVNIEWFGNSEERYNYFDCYLRKSAKNVDRIVAVSESTKKTVIDLYGIDEEKIDIVNPAMSLDMIKYDIQTEDVEQVKQKFGISDEYILSICTFEPRKNLVSLIRAYEIYRDTHKESSVKLVLTGKLGWNYKQILAQLKACKYNSDVICTDYVSDYELAALYNGTLLFAYVSFYEGFGMPILEALNYGKPVLTSDTTSMPEVGGNAVCYCNPYELESIYNALERMLEDNDYRTQLGQMAKKQAEKFTYYKSAQKLEEIYANML